MKFHYVSKLFGVYANAFTKSSFNMPFGITGMFNQLFYCNCSLVFNNKEKLELLNSLTHPATIRDANNWMINQKSPYSIKEAALIFESGSAEHLDYVIGVYTPLPLRIKRIMERDHLGSEEVMKRMSRQIDEDVKMRLCDTVIINDEEHIVTTQVLELHNRLLILSTQ